MARRWKVLLCGYYGMGNAGDEFLATASIALLERCGVSREQIAILSGKPDESRQTHGVEAFDRWSLKEVARAAKMSETLLLGGGGIFQDSSGTLSPLYYWGVIRLARLLGCTVWAVGQSIGPLRSPLNRFVAKNAFSCCAATTVRDIHSHAFLNGRCALADDLVLTLPASPKSAARDKVLVNFRPAGGLEREAAQSFSQSELAHGAPVVGVAMSGEDSKTMEELAQSDLLKLDELRLCTVANWRDVFSDGACAFGMRLHFGVMCLEHDIPAQLVPYDPKVSDFAARWGTPLWNGSVVAPPAWRERAALEAAVKKTISSFEAAFKKAVNV